MKGACAQGGEYRPPRFKPAIEYFFDTLENPFSLFRRDGYMVDTLTVKVRDPGYARQFFQLFNGANANDLNPQKSEPVAHIVKAGYLLHILTSPEGDGRPPIPVP